MDWTDKKVLVVGMARSGVAAAALLARLGARVTANDSKTAQQLEEPAKALEKLAGVHTAFGQPAADLLNGQEALVISPGIPVDAPFVTQAREMGIEVLGELELGARLTDKPILAITGTNGKTTTTTLVGLMMQMNGQRTGVVGNIGEPLCAHVCRPDEEDVYVAEVSSFQLETVKSFRPSVSAILNLTPDHLNRHYTMENYLDVKCRIFENQSGEDVLVLNRDDETLRGVAQRAHCRVAWFSIREEVDEGCFVRDGRIVVRRDGQEQVLCRADEVRIPGPHNLSNALAASACALYAGASPKAVRHSLATFEGVEHRLEFVESIRGVRFINDSKGTNPDSTIKAVEAMTLPTVLIAGGYDKKTGFAELMAKLPGSRIVGLVVLGQTADELERDARAVGFSPVRRAEGFRQAVLMAYEMAHTGYNVLLSPACASFDMFRDYEERGRVFKDLVAELARGKE
ncbi:MAG: UDP-N-acetylmuramoyl-L-alanine--D-glutamate ligase [Eubacteriales bacterium]|nr:UDP-N-acetylmuramoyl-L-alanine--D-glutamate ligase [Eubacteriales bacterium]